ncbi:hypothetical protein E2C01_067762 [Portunus trituberculatus]|uniref:Uncharacterized protein n=1 Tax=Portunus trituberculatus TaxID=210409 RepID=A0A5B7HTR7_PORTR|nr:hypothetical protein [Portunus trituberculatus]
MRTNFRRRSSPPRAMLIGPSMRPHSELLPGRILPRAHLWWSMGPAFYHHGCKVLCRSCSKTTLHCSCQGLLWDRVCSPHSSHRSGARIKEENAPCSDSAEPAVGQTVDGRGPFRLLGPKQSSGPGVVAGGPGLGTGSIRSTGYPRYLSLYKYLERMVERLLSFRTL